jgi:hypothetical protein
MKQDKLYSFQMTFVMDLYECSYKKYTLYKLDLEVILLFNLRTWY